MSTKNNPGDYDCYENAEPDEPMFVLLARDQDASATVRSWAYAYAKRKFRPGAPKRVYKKYDEARRCADDMDRWRSSHKP